MEKQDLSKTVVEVINAYAPEKSVTETDITSAIGSVKEAKQDTGIMMGVRSITITMTKDGARKMQMQTGDSEPKIHPVDPDSLFAKLVNQIHKE